MDPQGLQLLVSVVTGACATFFAIMLWPKTRDPAWMLIIVGTIIHYAGIIFQALEVFGAARIQVSGAVFGAILRAILLNIPFLFYMAGFIIANRRRDR